MGLKLSAVFAVLMMAMAGAFYWYYNDTQERIGVLRENAARLETAVQISEESVSMLQDEVKRFAEANRQLQSDLQKAEQYGDELRTKLREHDLTALAIRKPGLLEGKMNGATANLWRELEQITGGEPDNSLPDWLQSDSETGAGGAGSDPSGEDTDTDSRAPETSTTD